MFNGKKSLKSEKKLTLLNVNVYLLIYSKYVFNLYERIKLE